ncbi:MAG: biopolymer transporter ExbD [Pseudomonadota bacterium]
MRRRQRRTGREPTIALINIVFLMLVFFMVAGTIARPLEDGLELVETSTLEGREPPDALVIHADGRLAFRGAAVASPDDYLAAAETGAEIRVVPDRALPAADLLRVAEALRRGGAERVLIVTRRAVP